MSPLNVSVSELEPEDSGSCVIVSVTGRASVDDCAWFRQLLEVQAAQTPSRIVVDLSRLSSMDWWAALILLWAGRVVHRRGGTLVLASPQPAVARVLASAGAPQVIPVYDSVRQATGTSPISHYAAR